MEIEEWPDNWPMSACKFADEANEKIDEANETILRLRVAISKAAQRAADWPDSNDDPADVLSDCVNILYAALDDHKV